MIRLARDFFSRRWRRIFLLISSPLLLLAVAIIVIYFWALHSESGAQWIWHQAEARVPGLQAGQIRGSLSSGIQIDNIQYTTATTKIRVQQTQFEVNIDLLPQPKVEILHLTVHQLRSQSLPVTEPAEAVALSEWPDLRSPILIQIPQLSITDIQILDAKSESLASLHQLQATVSYKDALAIEALELNTLQFMNRQQNVSAELESQLSFPFEHQLKLTADSTNIATTGKSIATTNAIPPIEFKLTSKGNLAALQLQVIADSENWFSGMNADIAAQFTEIDEAPHLNASVQLPLLAWPPTQRNTQVRDIHLEMMGQWPRLSLTANGNVTMPQDYSGLWQVSAQQEEAVWQFNELSFDSSTFSIAGQGAWDTGNNNGKAQLDIKRIIPSAFNEQLNALGEWEGSIDLEKTEDFIHVRNTQLKQKEGPAQIKAQGQYLVSTHQIDAEIQWNDLLWPQATREISSPKGQLKLNGELGHYQAQANIQLLSPLSEEQEAIPIDITLDGQGDQAKFDLSSFAIQAATSTLNVKGQVQWSPLISWQLDINSNAFNPALFIQDVPGSLNLKAHSEGMQQGDDFNASLTLEQLSGDLLERPISGQGMLEYHQGQLSSQGMQINSGTTLLELQSRFEQSEATTSNAKPVEEQARQVHSTEQTQRSIEFAPLRFSLSSGNVNEWVKSVSGFLKLDGWIHFNGEQWQGEVKAQSDLLQHDALNVKQLQFAADWQAPKSFQLTPDTEWVLQLSGNSQGIRFAGLDGEHRAALKLNAKPKASLLEFDLESPDEMQALAFKLNIPSLNETPVDVTAQIEEFSLQHPQLGVWSIKQDAELDFLYPQTSAPATPWSLHTNTTAPLCLQQNARSAKLCIQTQINASEITAQLQLDALALNTLNPWLQPYRLPQGRLNAALDISINDGAVSDLRSFVDIQHAYLELPSKQYFQNLDDNEQQGLMIPRVQLHAHTDAQQALQLSLQTELQDQGTIEGAWQLSHWNQPDQLSINGEFDIHWPQLSDLYYLLPQLGPLQGQLDTHWKTHGHWRELQLDGALTLSNLDWVQPDTGIHFRNGNIQLHTLDRQTIALNGQAKLGDGQARFDGQINPHTLNWSLNLAGESLELLNSSHGRIIASTDLKLAGDTSQLHINGDIFVPEATLQPVAANNPVNESPDIVIAGRTKEVTGPETKIDGQLSITLGDGVKVRAGNARSQLAGGLNLRWNGPLIPEGKGEIRLENGSIRAYGQNLDIEEGQVLFEQGPVDNPRLNIKAARRIFGDPVVEQAGVAVRGTAQSPEVEIYTNPHTNEERALTYLITGSNFDHGNGQGALSVGLYLLPKLFISYGFGLFENGNVISTRYELSRRWSIQAISGARDTGVDIDWSVDR